MKHPCAAIRGPWSGCSRSTDAHFAAEPTGLFPCCSPRIHLRPTQASLAQVLLSLLVVLLQLLTHTSPPGGLPWLPTFSLERNLVFPASCVFFSSKHMHMRLFLRSLSDFLSLLLFPAFLDDRMYFLKKGLNNLQNIHASRLRAPWAFVFRLIHGLISIVIGVSPKCQIPFCHYALLFSSCFLGSPQFEINMPISELHTTQLWVIFLCFYQFPGIKIFHWQIALQFDLKYLFAILSQKDLDISVFCPSYSKHVLKKKYMK